MRNFTRRTTRPVEESASVWARDPQADAELTIDYIKHLRARLRRAESANAWFRAQYPAQLAATTLAVVQSQTALDRAADLLVELAGELRPAPVRETSGIRSVA